MGLELGLSFFAYACPCCMKETGVGSTRVLAKHMSAAVVMEGLLHHLELREQEKGQKEEQNILKESSRGTLRPLVPCLLTSPKLPPLSNVWPELIGGGAYPRSVSRFWIIDERIDWMPYFPATWVGYPCRRPV